VCDFAQMDGFTRARATAAGSSVEDEDSDDGGD